MRPVLYKPTEKTFENNGIGVLSSVISCEVTEERNGAYELVMMYPMTGLHFRELAQRSIILAKPNANDKPQPFRVYRITRPIGGVCVVYAEHVSYDLAGITVRPFTAGSATDAMLKLKSASVDPNPFTFSTNKDTVANMTVTIPANIRNLMGGVAGSVLDCYGGEYHYDRFEVELLAARGANKGVSIRYGKNLTDFQQDENCSNVYTGVYPYWTDSEGHVTTLPEEVVAAEGAYDFTRTLVLDFSGKWQDQPTEAQLRDAAVSYMKNNGVGVPKVSIKVSFELLSQTDEYKDLALLEGVSLCDTVNVEFPSMGVSADAKCIKTVYDVLKEKYTSIELGEARTNLATYIVGQEEETEERIVDASSHMQKAIDNATKWITNGKGYMVGVRDEDGNLREWASLDQKGIENAKNVWRWNNGGFGHSSQGYNGPFATAITQDGHIVADFINTGTLIASIIKAGILSDKNNLNFWNLDTGEFRMSSTAKVGDKTVPEIADEAINNFVDATLDPALANLQKQIDGQIETFFYDHEPFLSNEPAIGWQTEEDKAKHEGDLFYWRSKGYAYRFFKEGTEWKWQLVQDTDITKALANAAAAKDTADSKRRVFVTQPTPPYDVGDLWTQGENGDIMRCSTARASGNYSAGDWVKASKYIDKSTADSAAKSAVDAQTQEQIFNKLTDGGQIKGLIMANGQLYINADFINTGTLNADLIKFSGTGSYLDGTTLRINHPSLNAQTELGLDGFRMLLNGQIVGGLFKLNGNVVSAVQTLLNPKQDNFMVTVAPVDIEGEQAGLHFIINGEDVGRISASWNGYDAAFRFDAKGQLGLYSEGDIVLAAGTESISLSRENGMTFSFLGYDGVSHSFTARDLWELVRYID